MKAFPTQISFLTRLGAALLVSGSVPLFAANVDWDGGNGSWSTGSWLSGGVSSAPPTAADIARFYIYAGQPAVSNVSIGDNETVYASYLTIGRGKTLNLSLGSGALLSQGSATWQIGSAVTGETGTGAATLKISGDGANRATVNIGTGGMNIGSNNHVGTTVEFTGNLDVTSGNTVVVGRFGNGHKLTVSNGSKFAGTALWVGATQNITNGVGNNNALVIKGAGTEVVVSTTATTALVIAARDLTGADASNMQSGNYVSVENGAKLVVDGSLATTTANVKVGDLNFRSGNYISVTGAGSQMILEGKTSLLIGTTGTNYNNYVTVSNGGVVKNDGKTTISHSSTSGNAKNRLVIGSGGTFLSGSDITNNGGLIQLADTGVLRGETVAGVATDVVVTVQKSGSAIGRFEVAGSGLASNVSAVIGDGGLLAIGLAGSNTATAFDLKSTISMQNGSTFEITLFGGGTGSVVNIGSNGFLDLNGNVSLTLNLKGTGPQAGDHWTIFTGQTDHITGSFLLGSSSMPSLSGGLEWDYSKFNQNDGWQIGVIPEPGSVALLIGAGAVLALSIRGTRRSANGAIV